MQFLIYLIIFSFIFYGLRKIMRDWRSRYAQFDEQKHKRDLKERDRGDVIDLKADEDGVFRPDDEDNKK